MDMFIDNVAEIRTILLRRASSNPKKYSKKFTILQLLFLTVFVSINKQGTISNSLSATIKII